MAAKATRRKSAKLFWTGRSRVRARLERAGTPIGSLDTIIAAEAVARDLTLVTNNEREFRRVPGLRIENWRS